MGPSPFGTRGRAASRHTDHDRRGRGDRRARCCDRRARQCCCSAGAARPTVLSDADPVPSPYDGPMRAGKALECDGQAVRPRRRGLRRRTGGGPGRRDRGARGLLRQRGLGRAVARRRLPGGARGRRPGAAVVGRRPAHQGGVRRRRRHHRLPGHRGWGVETWAQCNAAELSEDELDDLGVQIWKDADGNRVPTTEVTSFQGADHCDWQDITFVMLGGERKGRQFLRDVDGELADLTRTTYDGSATLPGRRPGHRVPSRGPGALGDQGARRTS